MGRAGIFWAAGICQPPFLPIFELQAGPLKAPGPWAMGPGRSPTHLKMKVLLKKKNLDVTKKVHFLSVLS